MINEGRSYASLSSGLLARKGAAKPAMRPQGFGGIEDLGWNDMGYAQPPSAAEPELAPVSDHVPSSIAALTPAPKLPRGEEPSVVAQQRAIAENYDEEEEAPVEIEEAPVAAARAEVVALPERVRRPAAKAVAVASGKKAAFTLRLDPDRHLRLRLACAVTGRSAQQIVAGALDSALAAIPEVETLAERVPATGAKRN
jgi:hypothetical protein